MIKLKCKQFVFPWESIIPGSNIIIYGGGEVGRSYLSQLRDSNYCRIIALCDKRPENVEIYSVRVIGIDELTEINSSYYSNILIAIENINTAEAIKADLIRLGIPVNKLIWSKPEIRYVEDIFSHKDIINMDNRIAYLENIVNRFYDTYLLDNTLSKNRIEPCSYNEFINKLRTSNVVLSSWLSDWKSIMKQYPSFFRGKCKFACEDISTCADYYIIWGTHFYIKDNHEVLQYAVQNDKPIVVAESGFIDRIVWPSHDNKYSQSLSFTFDDYAPYYDARYSSRLELMLNDKNLTLEDEQKERARKLIKKIVDNHLTKYNHQPIFKPQIGKNNKKKILVVDQVREDMSILKGMANAESFNIMLRDAITNNPGADIIIKAHPDNIQAGKLTGYSNMDNYENIYVMDENINPISLIEYCDEVYVCTSQMGMEALMCGKSVHTYGMPFYAGWGLTDDHIICNRRIHKRSLEELFYIVYIMYSHYIHPENGNIIDIEEAIECLLKLRNEYYNKCTV